MDEDRDQPKDAEEGSKPIHEFLPPLEFGSIVFPFYTQALVKMGLMDDPIRGVPAVDVEFAKRLIDLLDLLQERTRGNLKPEEADFLESCLVQLKMHYMQKANILKI